ncbi:MAG: hypothetical protein ACOYLO_15490 [Ferruginibacter sp.]
MTAKKIILGNLDCHRLTSEAQAIVSPEIQAKYFALKAKYDHSFQSDRKEHLAFLFKLTTDKVRSLLPTDPIRYRMELLGTWGIFGQNAGSVIQLMDTFGMLTDYQYLQQWDLHDLKMFIWKLENVYSIKDISAADLLNCTDFKALFSLYLRGNVDKKAVAYSTKLQEATDSLFKGLNLDEKSLLMAKLTAYVFAPSPMDADLFHNLLHS